MQRFTENLVKEKLANLKNWNIEKNSLIKEFELKNFTNAIAFIVKIGIEVEKMDHHPDLLLHGWNKVKVTLSTHDAGGITENDFSLAQQIEKIN